MLLAASNQSLSLVDPGTAGIIRNFKHSLPSGAAWHRAWGLLVVQQGKQLVHQYDRREAPCKKLIAPEKLSGSIAISPNGNYLALGSISGRVFLWYLPSGTLVGVSDAHFQSVKTLCFSADSSVLISGAEDSRVCIFRVLGLEVVHVLTSHTLSITGVVVGAGIWREARLWTASRDATICCFDIHTATLLYTFVLPEPVSSLAVDPAERIIYAGTASGIRRIPLYEVNTHSGRLEMTGGGSQLINCDNAVQWRTPSCSTVLCLSDDGVRLFAGYEDGSSSLWETGTGQETKKYRSLKGPVLSLLVVPENLESENFGEVPALQRTVEAMGDIIRPLHSTAVSTREANDNKKEVVSVSDEQELNDIFCTESTESTGNVTPANDDLQGKYDLLKRMYDELWGRYVAIQK